MVTRGCRVTRFRGRYYRFYHDGDSHPRALGKDIVKEIPADPAAYQEWLAKRREEALEWHNAVERFLCQPYGEDVKDLDDFHVDPTEKKKTAEDNQKLWGVATDVLPDFAPVLNDADIKWVYTIDLDNEVFTINNSAHVRLIGASDLAWTKALAHGHYGDAFLSPGSIPEEAIADIVVQLPVPSPDILDKFTNLDVKIVQAKGLAGFAPSHRHGPLFRSTVFYFFREVYEPILAAALMSWRSEDLIFRDIAYAALSLASANLYPSIVSGPCIGRNDRRACAVLYPEDKSGKNEFISHLGIGSHLKDVLPGSSPDSGTYWFERVLVHLVAQLFDRDDIANAAVIFVVEYCQRERPNQRVDVILMSVEHVVLMTIHSDGRVERTEPLPLFDIQVHTTKKPDVRYSDLEEWNNHKKRALKRRKTRERRWRKKIRIAARSEPNEDEAKDTPPPSESDESEDEGRAGVQEQTSWPVAGLRPPRIKKSEAGFLALAFFLETSSRRHLPSSTTQEGVFPTELYRAVLLNIEDVKTQRACMQVSTNFRDMCQQDIVIMDDFSLQANEESQTYDPATASFPATASYRATLSYLATASYPATAPFLPLTDPFPSLRIKVMKTGRFYDVNLTRFKDWTRNTTFGPWKRRPPDQNWWIIVGSERNRRSLVPNLVVSHDKYIEDLGLNLRIEYSPVSE